VSELDRLAAACLQPSFAGHDVPPWAARWLDRGLGAITLFADNVGDPVQLAHLTAALRSERPELVLSIDEEGGDVTRLEADRGSSYPGNAALGGVDDPALTEHVAGAITGELATAGIDLNLAPVADVNSNPRNPVIGVRSFGSDSELVARHVAAFVTGTQRQGVAACAKHFPGHGDTSADSHRELPVAGGDLEDALLPFRAAIDANVKVVMVGHLLLPALDDVPATLSRTIVTDLLREQLGFDGVVMTDALEMAAVSATYGVEEAAVRALIAGADTLGLGHDLHEEAVERVHAAIVDAVRSGRLDEARLGEAASRVTALAAWTSPIADGAAGRDLGAEAACRAVARFGVTAVHGPVLVLELVPEANIAAGDAEHGLVDVLDDALAVQLREPPADLPRLLAGHDGRRLVVVTRDAPRHVWQGETVAAAAAIRPDLVVVETGLPGRTLDAANLIATYGAGRANLAAAAAALRPGND
jgi:beta-N-acetylhexosaminidase